MRERIPESRQTLLENTPTREIIAGIIPHLVCAGADIKQLSDEIVAIFVAKTNTIADGGVTVADISRVLEVVNDFESQSIYLCANVRVAARRLLAGRGINVNAEDSHQPAAITRFVGQRRANEVLAGVVTDESIFGTNRPRIARSSASSISTDFAGGINTPILDESNSDRAQITENGDDQSNIADTKLVADVEEPRAIFDEFISGQNKLFGREVENATMVVGREVQVVLRAVAGNDDQRTIILSIKEDTLEKLNTAYQKETGGLTEALRNILEEQAQFSVNQDMLNVFESESRRRLGRFKLTLVKLHTQLKQSLVASKVKPSAETAIDHATPRSEVEESKDSPKTKPVNSPNTPMSEGAVKSRLANLREVYDFCQKTMSKRFADLPVTYGVHETGDEALHSFTPQIKAIESVYAQGRYDITNSKDWGAVSYFEDITIRKIEQLCANFLNERMPVLKLPVFQEFPDYWSYASSTDFPERCIENWLESRKTHFRWLGTIKESILAWMMRIVEQKFRTEKSLLPQFGSVLESVIADYCGSIVKNSSLGLRALFRRDVYSYEDEACVEACLQILEDTHVGGARRLQKRREHLFTREMKLTLQHLADPFALWFSDKEAAEEWAAIDAKYGFQPVPARRPTFAKFCHI